MSPTEISHQDNEKIFNELKAVFCDCVNKFHPLPRTGTPLSDSEISGMLIGLLMAGQHTSSTTSAWLGFFLAQDKDLQVKYDLLNV